MGDGSSPIRILHVDDDQEFTELAASQLERSEGRIEVHTATSAEEGGQVLSEREIDCVVSDYNMPKKDGIEFLETVREEHPDLPFILYTGTGSEEIASEAISAGVTDYLQKDVRADQWDLLANRIRNAVEQFRANRRATIQDRISTVVRKINEALASATTQAEIDDSVCEIISDAEPYRFAWIGEHDPESGTVDPRASAGIETEYLDTVEITTDTSPTGQGPTGQAIRDHELVVMQNIPEDPRYDPWREQALERGYRSSAAVPLVYDDTLYGVLNVYAKRTNAFDERERRMLENLGRTIAHASHRVELQRQYVDQYRVLFEEAPVMVVFTRAVDGKPIIEDCNRTFTEQLGYTREELTGTPLADYYTEESTQRLLGEDGYRRALTGEFVREQRTLLTCDGEEVRTILRASPRRNREGKIVGTHALFLDITDEQLVTELKRKNERLDEFIGIVSHDLRNPLNVASARLELVADECDSEHLDHVTQAHQRMEDLIEDLLRLARTDDPVTEPEQLDLTGVVEGCWETVETTEASLEIGTDRRVLADESRLKQLFENLVRNAIEHGGEDVTVTVGELEDGFYVADDGSGIETDGDEDVFEAGYSTTTDGTGFGLSIVKGIVEAHDWEVRVAESADGGARFEITGVEFDDS